jgi:outer membrane protein assembly factor BamA
MSVSKVNVALAVLLTASALGVGLGVSQHASPGGRHAGAGRASTPGAGQASGRQWPCDDALAFGRYYAGGFHSLRGFEFRGVPPKAGSAESGCEGPGAPGREPRDILVDVQEQPTGSLRFGLGVNSDAGLTGGTVLNERNFDILRPPGSFAGLFSGSAFRGAGQEFRIEAVPGTRLERYTASWRAPFLFGTPNSLGVGPDFEGPKLRGDFMFLNSIEYQVPVRANGGIFLEAFVDGGTVEQKVEVKDYRVPAGFGVRFAIPMMGPVPIALDLAFPLVGPGRERAPASALPSRPHQPIRYGRLT